MKTARLQRVGWMLVLFFGLTLSAIAQEKRVEGKVTDPAGQPLPGTSVLVKGTNRGTVSDLDGLYNLMTTPSDTLVFSFIGFEKTERLVGNSSIINITLQEGIEIGEVVVTALGMERDAKALGYAVQTVDGDRFSEARETNVLNSLSGRVAGVNVTNGSSGLGGSTRVTIRGESSLNINANQPLFVVDGIPISNNLTGSSGSGNQEVDYGNAAGDINPDDIASMTVLKGPAAAALYGSRAANGAILITTKTGKGKKGFGVTINSNTTFDSPLVMPQWQDRYGQGNNGQFSFVDGAGSGIADGVDESWGPELDKGLLIPQFDSPRNIPGFRGGDLNAPTGSTITPTPWVSQPNNINDFFQTGVTLANNVSVGAANDKANVRFSWTNLDQKGIVPNTDLKRNTLAMNTGINIVPDKLTLNSTFNYQNTNSGNRPNISYGTENLMYLWIWYGRQLNTGNLRDYWMPGLEGVQQFNYNYNYHDNPYFNVFENTNGQQKDRVFGNVSLNYKITEKLNLMVRTGLDTYNELRDRKRAFSTQRFPRGNYREDNVYFMERNSDFLLSYSETGNMNWTYNIALGGNLMSQENRFMQVVAPELLIPGIYNFTNTAVALQTSQFNSTKKINSLYGFGQIGYKNILFLDITGRNDWSSTLPVNNNSYFYPSATLSAIVSDMFQMPKSVSLVKVRAAYAEVGNDTSPYSLTNVFNNQVAWGSDQAKTESSVLSNADLRPERTASTEFGLDLRFFENRLGFDFTYYDNVTRDQIIPITLDIATGYNSRIINAGKIQNSGIEIVMLANPIKKQSGFRWDIVANFTRNRGKVLELTEGLDTYTLTERNGAFVQARIGERMGNIYGVGFARVEDENSPYFGQIIHNSTGTPLRDSELKLQGNYNPDWMLGIQNNFTYKNFNLGFLFDIRYGGIVVSRTKTIGSTSGQLEETLLGRENGYDLSVEGNGIISPGVIQNADGTFTPNTIKITSRNWHNRYYERNNVEAAKYDASYVKLREVTLGYNIPRELIRKSPFEDIKISLVARNLALWTENPHFDPETLSMSGGTLQPGVENMSFPSTRSIGFNINLKF
ncbi:SusC/RagA family TonB-linked outer membrane protein [Aquiflexum gelatinilyticum]|uniref:SusC/RagA family TonB-linked outer membrane protein n=1 Tax=Aquiflexum gelatinilyticum TaxID=2961943 RepID=A0A9X2SY55_9BACT|nr:SusC/RagA family TonB-linked outer membrane protein [Aquiflexum gelatinilyticum]MCR9014659.1 SusC/RagA family TonB-linked outer membrane protein [Aquiflexum gelatinilyticum]MCS4434367.1 SusC/RagA family TonB-linked outer membrane protein [Aquiflexum gelatinilyticum]